MHACASPILGAGRALSESVVAALLSRVGALDGGLASDLRAAFDNAMRMRVRPLTLRMRVRKRPIG